MGLDNGIYLRYRKHLNNPYKDDTQEILDKLIEDEDYDNSYNPYFNNICNAICYWRKCWGLRNSVMSYLGKKYQEYDRSAYELDMEDIDTIIEMILKTIQNPLEWESPVWTWREYLNNNVQNYANLLRLRKDFKDKFLDTEEIAVIWYDSY